MANRLYNQQISPKGYKRGGGVTGKTATTKTTTTTKSEKKPGFFKRTIGRIRKKIVPTFSEQFADAKKKGKKPTITVTTPDRLASMKIMTPKESYDALIESGIFSEEEIAKFIWVEFDDFEESVEHRRNPEKYAEKPDDELSFEQRRKKRNK